MTRIQLKPEYLPDGRYPLCIVKARPANSQAGHPTLRLTFEVMEGSHAGYAILCTYSLLPQARWKLRHLLRAAGLPELDNELETSDLINLRLVADIRCRSSLFGPPTYDLDDECPFAVQP